MDTNFSVYYTYTDLQNIKIYSEDVRKFKSKVEIKFCLGIREKRSEGEGGEGERDFIWIVYFIKNLPPVVGM